jgi:hypothetical protein
MKVTYCTVLDSVSDTWEKEEYLENLTLKIRNVESYYNYRTVEIENEIKIVSSGLSSENKFIELIGFTTGADKNLEYSVQDERIIPAQDVKLQHLYLKKCRMQGFLAKVLENPLKTTTVINPAITTSTQSIPLSKTNIPSASFTNDVLINTTSSADTATINSNPKPKFCKEKDTNSKSACIKCKQICSFPIEMILDPKNHLSQDDIRDELQLHGHPKSRVMDQQYINGKSKKIGAKSHEQARELADHYIFSHNKKEPFFL